MKDKLEQFCKSQREAFDSEAPGPAIWQHIQETLDEDRPQRTRKYIFLWKAAAILLLIACSTLLIMWKRDNTSPAQNAGLQEVESFYFQQINQKQQQIEDLVSYDPNLNASFRSDIHSLDSIYLLLKNELADNYNEKVVDAMINNLKLRSAILNKQIMILERIKNTKNIKNDENITI